jgi:hypothetical protein
MDETYGIPAEFIAALCGVDLSTARRWKNGTSRIPMTARKLLAGDLEAFDPVWRGWTVKRGELVSPEGWIATPGEVRSIPLLRARISQLERMVRDATRLEEQPEIPYGRQANSNS